MSTKNDQESKPKQPPINSSPLQHPYYPGAGAPGYPPPPYDANVFAAMNPHMFHSPHRNMNQNGGIPSSQSSGGSPQEQQNNNWQAPPPPKPTLYPYDAKMWNEAGRGAPPPPFAYPYGGWNFMQQNFHKASPKKKKPEKEEVRATSPTEIENSHKEDVQHMGCTCRRTKCLKLYCQCFGVKIHCGSNCRCTECHNTTEYERERDKAIQAILSRNPSAFDSKFKADQLTDDQKLLAHKTGCRCRKSNCMKKYCECYAGNVRCTKNCRCVGCKNIGAEGPLDPKTPPRASRPVPVHPQSAPAKFMAKDIKGETDHVAAKSLTFLKRGTPESKVKQEIPLLASSSEGTSPGKEDGMSSLMLAAFAMTEFSNAKSPKKRLKLDYVEEGDEQVFSTTPKAPHSS